MYEAATGRVPFEGDDAISVALKQVNEQPMPPSQINPNVDPSLESIILKCMQKDPAARFQTADQLNRVLRDYIAGRLQEVQRDARGIDRLDSLFMARYGRNCKSDVVEAGEVVLRTYSRYPIIASGSISGAGRGTSQWLDVIVRNDTLRIFNNHLYTMNISAGDSEDIASGTILNDGGRMRSIVDRIANNSSIRASHVDTLRMVIDNTPYAHVICGDFNDTPMSYVYGELIKGKKDAFVEGGSGFGYTFRPMYGTLRIDYILHSEGLDTKNYSVDTEVTLSDHLPVTARVKFNK
jgi:serine/threonine protein kinase